MILYFSGTGNSRYTARLIAHIAEDELVSINDLLKRGGTHTLPSDRPFVFVTPVYAWRIPGIVRDFIRAAKFEGSQKAYFVTTCGDSTGNSAFYNKRLCGEKGFSYLGSASIVMPENYLVMYPVPDEKECKDIIRAAVPPIRAAAERIRDGKSLPEEPSTTAGKVQSALINPLFYALVVSAKGFYATDACTGCGTCATLCPTGTIRLTGGKPSWGNGCTHCMACICACPPKAIEYGNKTKNRLRYFNTTEPVL